MANEIPYRNFTEKEAEQLRRETAQLKAKRGRASRKDSAPIKTYRYKSKDGSYRFVCI